VRNFLNIFFFLHTVETVNSSSVDRIEVALRNKIETSSGFTEDPAKAVEKVFKKFDKNGTGKLSLDEFLAGMQTMSFQGYEKDCTALFRRYDLDKSGSLDFKSVTLLLCLWASHL